MTEKKNQSIRYLTKQDVAGLHAKLAADALRDGDEPLPAFRYGRQDDIDALVAAPQQRFYGQDAYPTLAEKAAIIFYTVNRQRIFPNGNKRMSTLCLVTFLRLNGADLVIPTQELTAKAVWLATVEASGFPAVKADLVAWIEAHLRVLEM